MGRDHYEEADNYPLEPDTLERLLREQSELCFMWGTKEHWAVGVFMSYVWRDGSFWVTATQQRARMRAIARDPRVSVAVSSAGTSLGPSKTATAKGRVRIHEDARTKQWFYPALAARVIPRPAVLTRAFASLLDSERRVVIEVVPEKWLTFDASKMMADTAAAMAKVAMPASLSRLVQGLGANPDALARRLVDLLGLERPEGLLSPGARLKYVLRGR